MMDDEVCRVATYKRTSSDKQREYETIKTQTDVIGRYLQEHPELRVCGEYQDDGVTGDLPLAERPGGAQLLRDAAAKRFSKVIITRAERLGRDKIDLMMARRRLAELGVSLTGTSEHIEDELSFDIKAVVSDFDKRRILERLSEGTNRAAKEGRYCGGIVPLGYKVEGEKPKARLVPSDIPYWADWTEADCVRWMYDRLALDGWSCRRIAEYLNGLGVPTVYAKDARLVSKRKGERKFRTQEKWRPGRIRNLIVNPLYRGEMQYGRRSRKARDIISAPVPALVSAGVWQAAQDTLASNRRCAKNTPRVYLLRSLIVCGICGLHYCGSTGRGIIWYRCDGQLVERGPHEGRCPGKAMKECYLVLPIWTDIERFLRDPGDLLDDLAAERDSNGAAAIIQAQRLTLKAALDSFTTRRRRILDLYERTSIEVGELENRLEAIERERREVQAKLDALNAEPLPLEEVPVNIEELRRRLDEGLTEEQRYEIIHLLVRRITVHTEDVGGKKHASVVVEYKFPAAVVETFTGMDSLPRPA